MTELLSDLFIFELANNHQGQMEHAARIIRAMGDIARRHRIHAGVKFQYRDLDTFIHPAYRERTDVPHIPRFMGTRLDADTFRALVAEVHREGLVSICTPFDEASVALCVEHGVQILKVASCSADDWPLLEAVAATRKPVVISTAGLSLRDIDALARFAENRKLQHALLHCVGIYPTPAHLLNLGFISRMARRYPGVPVGYSGHEDPVDTGVVRMAVAQGARILERHVGIAAEGAPLNKYSLSPEQADAWVAAALDARAIVGRDDRRDVTADEKASLRSLKRGVFAARPVAKGTTITRDNVFFAMPCADGQTTSGDFGRHRAVFVASRDYAAGEAIHEPWTADVISLTRDFIHEAQGMLHEAGITIGPDVEVELSHHRGIANFRETGAIFITVVNRDYCKKLGVLLPEQSHPTHQHHVKEETFHMLWGDLEVVCDAQTVRMKPGDTLLVQPGTAHSFTTRRGAIFEEISTRSQRADSFYDDTRIQRLDPMERKTVLESW